MNTSKRTPEQLYAQHCDNLITETCLLNPELFLNDSLSIVNGLADHLGGFTGESDAEFTRWALAILNPAAERLCRFYRFKTKEHKEAVFGGLCKVLTSAADLVDDWDKLLQELEHECWTELFERLDAFVEPGTAKLTSRLFEFAKYKAMAWKTEQLRRRERFNDVEAGLIGYARDERGKAEIFVATSADSKPKSLRKDPEIRPAEPAESVTRQSQQILKGDRVLCFEHGTPNEVSEVIRNPEGLVHILGCGCHRGEARE
jgi:hypothetical protein